LNPKFFSFCQILNREGIRVSLLSTGLTIEKNAELIIEHVHDVIVSLDGDEKTHDNIRNIKGAFQKLKAGVERLRHLDPNYPITARTVIHRLNFQQWRAIIEAAKEMRLNQISFLPADVSSHAFNREVLWSSQRQQEILPDEVELKELSFILEDIIKVYMDDFSNGFIAENPSKLRRIPQYYSAFYNGQPFPWKKCNAPWVSTVIEADGTVRPCFFHAPLGNIRQNELVDILNSEEGIRFRKDLDMEKDSTCAKCVCYLNLSPGTRIS
jgi:MoaA/NifB/PqqE/SkfB family radical SAM enzyme